MYNIYERALTGQTNLHTLGWAEKTISRVDQGCKPLPTTRLSQDAKPANLLSFSYYRAKSGLLRTAENTMSHAEKGKMFKYNTRRIYV